MSWDLMILNLKGKKPPPLEQLQESDVVPLGPAQEVRDRLIALLPTINWSDPTWGVYDGDGFSIEFSVGAEEPVSSIMLHVHGGGDAIADIVKFARPLGWLALDCSTDEFLDLDSPSKLSWEGFKTYRDQVIGKVQIIDQH